MLKTPSPLQSRGSPPMGAWQPPTGFGAGSSPGFRWSFLRSWLMSPPSFHLIPESCTAISTSGRPVSRRHAISMLIPLTPRSSFGLAFTAGSVVQKFVLAYFHFSPLQLPAPPLISFGSGMQPSGRPELSQRFGSFGNGNSPPAGTASRTTASSGSASRRFMDPPPLRNRASRAVRLEPGNGQWKGIPGRDDSAYGSSGVGRKKKMRRGTRHGGTRHAVSGMVAAAMRGEGSGPPRRG